MIYDYLDKWLTENVRRWKILLSYETHRECRVGFGDHLICWLAAMSNTQASFSPATPVCHSSALDYYSSPQAWREVVNYMLFARGTQISGRRGPHCVELELGYQ